MGWSDDAARNRESWSRANTEYTGPRARLLSENELEIEQLIEVQAPETAKAHPRYDYVSQEWARQWAAEEIWAARKR